MMTIIIILSIALVAMIYMFVNLYNKYNVLDESFNQLKLEEDDKLVIFVDIRTRIEYCDRKLKELDIRGSFSSDDEVGFFFQEIKKMQEMLNFYQTLFLTNQNDKPIESTT